MDINMLAVGDIVGDAGLDFFCRKIAALKKYYNIAFTVVNGENASGMGITPGQAQRLYDYGADVITLGNHTWGCRELRTFLDDNSFIIRPANYAPQVPGCGVNISETGFGTVCTANLIGRCGMDFGPSNPFYKADDILKKYDADFYFFDFHAEATSEKLAMSYYLDGRAHALWGTHTHVQTSDACVKPGGLGYITDLGMTGPSDSVIGIAPELSVSRFLENPPERYIPAKGTAKLEGAVFTYDSASKKCKSVTPIRVE